MNNGRAFDIDDLAVLLALDPTDPADQADIESIDDILARRHALDPVGEDSYRNRAPLRLVPNTSPS